MKILLAEDNDIARTAIAAGLAAEGYDIDLAADGEEALILARREHPDLIISDVLMPRMDGYSLCQAVREDRRLDDVPVVFYSATFLDPKDEELARSVGASGFIHKDTDHQSFQHQLHDAIAASEGYYFSRPSDAPSGNAEIARQHHSALISKLKQKIDELERERWVLRESQQLLQHIVTAIPDVVFILDLPELKASYVAPEAERLLGYSGSEMIGDADRWMALVDEEDRERVVAKMHEAIESRKSTVILSRMRHKDGGFRWIEARISPRLSSDGTTLGLVGSLTDVSQRITAENRVRERERSLNTLFTNLPGMAYRCHNTPDWEMVFISAGAEAVTGYISEDFVGNAVISYNEIILPEERSRVWTEIQQALSERQQFSLAYRIRHKDGSIRWVWERGVGVPDEAGKELWVEGFITDITLRKRAEQELIESERRYRGLFEMMDDGMALHELVRDEQGKPVDYRFLEVNPAFERLTGLKAESVIGHTAREVLPGIKQQWIDDYIQVVLSGEPRRFTRYAKVLERYFDVVAYRNADNQFVTLFSDVTEQRRSDDTIRNLARFTEEDPSPVLRITPDGILLYANQASEVMSEGQALQPGVPLPDLLWRQIRQAEQNGGNFTCNFNDRWFSFLIRAVSEAGYINIYGREVTAEHQAEQKLVALNRVLKTLSEGNRVLVHAHNESSLLESICHVLTREGDYPAVWIATPQEDGTALNCIASDGPLKGKILQWRWQQVPLGEQQHPMVIAYRENKGIIISRNDSSSVDYGLEPAMTDIDIETVFLLPVGYHDQVFGVIGIFSRMPLEMQQEELTLLDELVSDLGFGVQSHRTTQAHEQSVLQLKDAMLHTVEAFSIALEKRDPYTAGHQNRVAALSVAIAREMGMEEQRVEGIRLGSMVHDIGKISVPAEILNRPGRLSDSEFGVIKAHPEAGYDVLKGIDFPWPIAQMALQHHERLDGSGYPFGLKGDEIVEEALILAVADVVEAITSHRPYRPGLGLEVALKEIERGRASSYAPQVVDACLRVFQHDFEWD
ncbi:MAG: PAS domain S-box protein [Gammaproteobacteria bacterium]|nr:PAS domain S-box protein [Gammaproteobacteria bacterium]